MHHAAREPGDPLHDRCRGRIELTRQTSPLTVSSASNVTCRRCTSNPATIAQARPRARTGRSAPSVWCHARPMQYRDSRSVLQCSNVRLHGCYRACLQPTSFDTEDRPAAAGPTATPRTRLLMSALSTISSCMRGCSDWVTTSSCCWRAPEPEGGPVRSDPARTSCCGSGSMIRRGSPMPGLALAAASRRSELSTILERRFGLDATQVPAADQATPHPV